jgi:hypothetical protein
MLNDTSRARLIGARFAAVAVTRAGNMIVGAPVTLGTSALLLVEIRAETHGPKRK